MTDPSQLAAEIAAIPSQSEAIDRCEWALELVRIQRTLDVLEGLRGPDVRELAAWWNGRRRDLEERLVVGAAL